MLLSYCTNVHPAEDLEGMLNQLRTYAGPIRAKAGLNSLGVGLWLPAVLAEELASSSSDRIALRELLTQQRLFIHTINAFPYGGFHNDIVKHDVYKPDWADPLRLEYTLNCAEVLADLLPDNVDGSISTLPLGWRDPWHEEKDIEATAAFVRLSEGLRDIKARTGRTIRVAVEPEPGCVLDDVADVVDWLAARITAGIDPEHIGICLDACHLAVSFADPADSVRLITEADLRVVKLQASAALHVQDPSQPTARDALDAFREPRYLHQVRELASDSVLRWMTFRRLSALFPAPVRGACTSTCHCTMFRPYRWPLRRTSSDQQLKLSAGPLTVRAPTLTLKPTPGAYCRKGRRAWSTELRPSWSGQRRSCSNPYLLCDPRDATAAQQPHLKEET
jgi:sugar phosphate isomerase/epimerase